MELPLGEVLIADTEAPLDAGLHARNRLPIMQPDEHGFTEVCGVRRLFQGAFLNMVNVEQRRRPRIILRHFLGAQVCVRVDMGQLLAGLKSVEDLGMVHMHQAKWGRIGWTRCRFGHLRQRRGHGRARRHVNRVRRHILAVGAVQINLESLERLQLVEWHRQPLVVQRDRLVRRCLQLIDGGCTYHVADGHDLAEAKGAGPRAIHTYIVRRQPQVRRVVHPQLLTERRGNVVVVRLATELHLDGCVVIHGLVEWAEDHRLPLEAVLEEAKRGFKGLAPTGAPGLEDDNVAVLELRSTELQPHVHWLAHQVRSILDLLER
mmetsp:Transcript_4367/g.17537  ORF Transcript_4367/g.17537 Transcript_4367/m.17537 type:complete len:319 (+) Transcript_4367:408-1364(+)